MWDRVILHSDLNCCYANIECMLNPALRGKYVAVCGNTAERHGIVLAKNQLAKQRGVKTGDVIWEARQKCPELVIVEPHMEQYLKYSQIVRDIYKRYSPEVEAFGIDESWINLTGTPLLRHRSPESIANEIREAVKSEVGLTVSIGVSFCKIFAKLGSDMKKPDAVTVIPKETFREQIWSLPASDLLYVGRATDNKLKKYGIHTIGDLAQAEPGFLHLLLGKNGVMLWRYANGLDNSRVMPYDFDPPIKSIGHGITCTADLYTEEEVRHIFLKLSQQVGRRLRQEDLAATKVQISIRDKSLSYREYQCKLPFPTQSFIEISKAGTSLFCDRYLWSYPVRSLTIRAIDLVPGDTPVQLDLFTDFSAHTKRMKLEQTMDDLRRRFGPNIINVAALTKDIKYPDRKEVEYRMPSAMYQ